ncbi:MAG: peptide-methionine (S)-S-oxide reductase MsrA [Deltaproteobacteria bacterium]|nr:peptide-methionine (S)-S-oxide reductase MsrA [Deltaproteobacteria bacterium]
MKHLRPLLLAALLLGTAALVASARAGDAPTPAPKPAAKGQEVAYLAGGCFWGMEDLIRELPGVIDTEVGYTGGDLANATYSDVKGGDSGHAESVRIVFDPKKVSYGELLDFFFRIHDPTTPNRQGNDRGTQYRSAIFTVGEKQVAEARAALERAGKSGRWKNPIVTQVVPAGPFWPAESYHQDYLEKNPSGYTCHYVRD